MSNSEADQTPETVQGPPPLRGDERGHLDTSSLAEVIQWFLDYDPRVAAIKHPYVEEIFQWKQEASRRAGEDVFAFNRAEDRLAIGIFQALAEHPNEATLHDWISQLLNTLNEATKASGEISGAYKLEINEGTSAVREAAKIPSAREREDFLVSCWLERLCTAEIRVLGWIYRELYGHAYAPG
jgi:hypothetical protein